MLIRFWAAAEVNENEYSQFRELLIQPTIQQLNKIIMPCELFMRFQFMLSR
jgi:hypothetical protein